MLQICPNLPGHKFIDPPFEEEILVLIRKLGYSRDIKSITDVKEDLVSQIENKVSKKNKDMYYPRFTKVIINHFMSKDQSIPRRNKVDWHMAKDDHILTTMRYIPKHETIQKYGAILPDTLTNQAMKESDAYKTYYDFATGKKSSGEDDDNEVSISKDNDDNADGEDDDDQDDDNEQTESDNDGDDFVHPKFSTHDEEKRQDEEDKDEEWSNQRVHTPSHYESSNDEAYDEVTQGVNVEKEKMDEEKTNEEDEINEMYSDVNINLERRDTEMTDAPQTNVQDTQVMEYTHVIITVVTPKVQPQSSSVSSGFISKMLNPILDTGIDSILNLNTESTSLVDVPVTTHDVIPPSSVITLLPPPIPLIQSIIKKSVNEQLEAEVLIRSSNEAKTSYAVAANLSELELKKILIDKMENNKSIDWSVQQKTLYKALVDAYETNKDILATYGDAKAREEPESTSAPKDKTSKSTGSSKEWSKSKTRSTGKSAQAEEQVHTVEDLEEPTHQEFNTGFTEDQPVDETTQLPDCTLAQNEDPRESFNELMDTPLDFSAFVLNRLKVDTLTLELLVGPTFELMKGSCKSLVELEYILEEVYKATTDQLD
ncbi:hypothetical protein Tco_0146133 [Tanacetum coccineum]